MKVDLVRHKRISDLRLLAVREGQSKYATLRANDIMGKGCSGPLKIGAAKRVELILSAFLPFFLHYEHDGIAMSSCLLTCCAGQ